MSSIANSKCINFKSCFRLYLLLQIEDDLKALAHTKGVERNIGVIDPKQVKLGSRKYYRYIGSLTVPPCTQDVVWTIVRKVI